jgi:hypothetical protein
LTLSPPVRSDILSALWSDYAFLKQLRDAIEKGSKRASDKTRFQVYIIQVQAQVCRATLQGLSDWELDDLKKDVDAIKEELKMNGVR